MNQQPIVILDDGNGELVPLAHHPKPRNQFNLRFPDLEETWAPPTWPALCGAGRGLVYIRDGSFANVETCIDCTVALEAAA